MEDDAVWPRVDLYDPENNPRLIVGTPVMKRLLNSDFVVVPFNIPDYAVGEVMEWTGVSPDVAWEALNCALNLIAHHRQYNPDYIQRLSRLGRGETE